MDIRGPRLRKPSDEALEFTSSLAQDGRIARQVVAVNVAHMAALVASGEVARSTGARCLAFLLNASIDIRPGSKSEDFHQQLEQDAVDALGVQTAGYLNYGKSRNDQVATAIRMELRVSLIDLIRATSELQESLLSLVRAHGPELMPGYTHLQRAQPVTFAHQMFAHFDAFQRDAERLLQSYARVNLSPMGSAAMAGTSARLDRREVARSLGFDGIVANAMDGVASRDFAVEVISAAVLTSLDSGRIAEELILWSSSEFGFVELDDAYSASSSIMPQKKNAVVAETVRAKEGSVIGSLMAVLSILKALPYSYNLDLQEATPHVWTAMDDAVASSRLLAAALKTMKFNTAAAKVAASADNSTAVALANYLVKEEGLSFREAHSIVGKLVRDASGRGISLKSALVGGKGIKTITGRRISIDVATLSHLLDPESFLAAITTEGGSNPKFIPQGLKTREAQLSSTRERTALLARALRLSERKLKTRATGICLEVKSKK